MPCTASPRNLIKTNLRLPKKNRAPCLPGYPGRERNISPGRSSLRYPWGGLEGSGFRVNPRTPSFFPRFPSSLLRAAYFHHYSAMIGLGCARSRHNRLHDRSKRCSDLDKLETWRTGGSSVLYNEIWTHHRRVWTLAKV